MIRATRSTLYLAVAYGIVAAVADGVACAAVSLKSFLSIPIWVSFVPVALAWIAAGIRGLKPEDLIGVGAISLVGGPIIAVKLVSLPVSAEESMAIGFSTIRQSLAISLAIMLPLCIACILAGVMIRGAIKNGRIKLPLWLLMR